MTQQFQSCGYIQKNPTNFKRYMHPNVHSSIIYNSQDKCLSTDEWIKKMWYTHTHTLGYYSAIKKNEILPFAAHGWT